MGNAFANGFREYIQRRSLVSKLPEPANNPLDSIANGFISAWNLYNSKHAVMLFIILDKERNISDQRHLEYAIRSKEPSVDVVRCTLAHLFDDGYMNENKQLF
jgi:hypothetical protein